MRVRLFEAVGPDYKGLTDIESEHLPAVGDLLSVEYGDAVYRIYRVIGRTLRVYAVKGKVYSVAL